MKLTIQRFKKFSQSSDIKADIGKGWCAGVTAVISDRIGAYSLELGGSKAEWLSDAFHQIEEVLDNINQGAVRNEAQLAQGWMGRVADQNDVCGSIHTDEFDGRPCKILLSTGGWIPALGYIGHAFINWNVNHIGLLLRAGNHMIIMDPNYGAGLFSIDDNQTLTLDNLTKAIRQLAWKHSYNLYYFSTTYAIRVIDQDAYGLRFSRDTEEKADRLKQMSQEMFGSRMQFGKTQTF